MCGHGVANERFYNNQNENDIHYTLQEIMCKFYTKS